MKTILALCLLGCSMFAQALPFAINMGGQAIGMYQADKYYTTPDCVLNSKGIPMSRPCSIAYSDVSMGSAPLDTLRYGYGGDALSYSIPFQNGIYEITFLLTEPTKTGPNQRMETITANGVISQSLDIFALGGGQKSAYRYKMLVMVSTGVLNITFKASLSNPLGSAIEVRVPYIPIQVTTLNGSETASGLLVQTTNGDLRLITVGQGLAVVSGVLNSTVQPAPPPTVATLTQWLQNSASTFQLLQIKRPDGTMTGQFYGIPVESGFTVDPNVWQAAQ